MFSPRCSLMLRIATVKWLVLLGGWAAEPIVDFASEVQPIFKEHCLDCHGPDKQKSDYRLDLREAALHGGESGEPAIVPGTSAESTLLKLVSGGDPERLMPPKKSDKTRLTTEQIALLRRWIDQGAVWPAGDTVKAKDPRDWWSFKAIARVAPPAEGHPIDAFVRATLREHGLSVSPEADRRTLIRRIYFDLTGLPPSSEEAEAFAADPDPRAYEKLVDCLLASPRYGERWARHWLDVVHFGETHGFDKDKPRLHAWPYRDYVIRAFNEDKPYTRFVQEQLAGDVLFPHTADGIEALGFIAAGPWDLIGHMEVPETKIDGKIARHLDRDDMVANTINTFSSLTVHCAQCHNHKFDPISQEDYYALQANFAALDRTDQTFDLDPAIDARRADLTGKQRDSKAKKEQLDQQLAKSGGRMVDLYDRLLNEARKGGEVAERAEFGWHSGIEKMQDTVKWVQVDLGRAAAIEQVVLVACHDNYNGIGAGFGYPVRLKVQMSDDETFARGAVTIKDQTAEDQPNPGVKPQRFAAGGRTARYLRVTAVKLAPRKGDFIFALAELQALDLAGRNLAFGTAVTSSDSIEAPSRWSRLNLTDGYFYGSIQKRPAKEIASLEAGRTAALASIAEPQLREESALNLRKLNEIEAALKALPPPRVAFIGAVRHGTGNFSGTGANGGRPRPIFLLARGDVTKPGKEVPPGALTAITALPARFGDTLSEGERRAALARWLTDPQNPLTWRSIVNRVWQYHFGRGIVDSPNDFGHMGQLPSHPELLDWLAAEFRDSGGSFKKLHRLIVTSATYKQTSTSRADYTALDANNAWLWRQNRRKLEAEAIRDSMLAAAGKLDLTMGGPSFQDFVIEKPEHSPHYQYQLADPEDPKLQRRSIYRFLVRSQQQPFMAALDCADPSMLVEKRNQTITPLQALAQLNNQLALAMAKDFAKRIAVDGSSLDEQIGVAFRVALARPPRDSERDALVAYARQYGLANTCRAILNLNEFAFID